METAIQAKERGEKNIHYQVKELALKCAEVPVLVWLKTVFRDLKNSRQVLVAQEKGFE